MQNNIFYANQHFAQHAKELEKPGDKTSELETPRCELLLRNWKNPTLAMVNILVFLATYTFYIAPVCTPLSGRPMLNIQLQMNDHKYTEDGYGEPPAKNTKRTSQPSFHEVQGQSVRTWTCMSPCVKQVRVVLKTSDRPMDADIDLWHGPDNTTPFKMRVYSENGHKYPFTTFIGMPYGPNSISIRNIGQMNPFVASVMGNQAQKSSSLSSTINIQGGALRTYKIDESVMQLFLKTDGRPLNSRVEIVHPNKDKQVIEVYAQNGRVRPFFCILKTVPGSVMRVVNTASVEFSLLASVVSCTDDPAAD